MFGEMTVLEIMLCMVIGYAFGCIQTAYIVGKLSANIDIREHGSGNAGSTNALRVMGKKAGAITFTGDVLKTLAAFILCCVLFGGGNAWEQWINPAQNLPVLYEKSALLPGMLAGVGVVIGHNWPVVLSFKGGRGFASTVALMLCVDWRAAIICYLFMIFILVTTRYVSLGSMLTSVLFVAMMITFKRSTIIVLLAVILAMFSLYRHRANIRRLLAGTESRIGEKKKKK